MFSPNRPLPLLGLLVLLSFPLRSAAQGLPPKEVKAAITTMARLVEESYVFPQRGRQIARQLVGDHKKGAFNRAQTWRGLDSLISRSLQAGGKDGHLYVRYDPKTVRELRDAQRQEAADPSTSKEQSFTHDPFYYGPDAVNNNFGFQEVKVLEGNIGYVKLSEINVSELSLPVLMAAMRFVANTKGLILDLRNNGGGGTAIGNVLESYFLPKETPLLHFRTRDSVGETAKTVSWLLEKKYDKPVFILVNEKTASAAEAFTYALQRHKRAKVVGQRSAGGAHMNSWYPVNDHLFISVSTGAPTWPGTEENWEQKGIQPDYVVADPEAITYAKQLMGNL